MNREQKTENIEQREKRTDSREQREREREREIEIEREREIKLVTFLRRTQSCYFMKHFHQPKEQPIYRSN